jgi:PAS domain S-box-containing protein
VATIYIVAFGIAVLWSAGLVARSEAMKKLADNSAREAEERYKALYESSRDAIMTLEPYGRFLGGNRAAIQLFGCKDEKEFTAQTPGSLSPERQADGELSADKANEMMRRAMEKGSNFFEWIHLSRDGHEFYATVLLTRMELEGKAILQATVRDITEEKKSERRIRQAAEEWQKTFDAISDLVFIQDATYTILNANRAFCEAMKMPLDEIRGRKCYQLLHGKNHPWPNCPMEKTRLDAKTHTEEVDDPNIGTALLVTTSPVFNERGEVAGSVHIARDISERKKLEDELTRKLDTLEKFQKVTVGRELTMKELKSKIALLETKIREMETKNG